MRRVVRAVDLTSSFTKRIGKSVPSVDANERRYCPAYLRLSFWGLYSSDRHKRWLAKNCKGSGA